MRPPGELLRPVSAGRLARAAAVDWAVVAALWALMAVDVRFAWLAVPVIGGRFHALGVLLHESCHASTRGTWRERALTLLCGLPLFTTVEAMRAHHLRHHARTNQPGDPYFDAHHRLGTQGTFFAMWLLLPSWAWRSAVGTLSRLVPSLRPRYGRALIDEDGVKPEVAEELDAAIRAEWPITLFALVAVALTPLAPTVLGLGLWLPLAFTSVFNAWRFVAEHPDIPSAGPSPSQALEVTRDHGRTWVSRAFLYPHGIGFHRAHHRFPSASFVHLEALNAWATQNGLL